jgi:hypothetical protein
VPSVTLARANIEPEAWTDPAFAMLARFLGLPDRDVALIRCAKLWAWQTAEYSPADPHYVVSAEVIETFLGHADAASAMVRAGLATEDPDGFYVKGSRGRIEWLWNLHQNGKKGGEATKRKHAAQVGQRSKRKRGDKTGPPAPATAGAPASAQLGLLDLDLDQNQKSEPGARARDPGVPTPGPATYMAPEQPPPATYRDPKPPNVIAIDPRARSREAIVREIPKLHAELFNRARTELALDVRPMGLVGDPAERALQQLLDQLPVLDGVLEDCKHVLAVRYAEAIDKRTVKFFDATVWLPVCFGKAKSMTVAEASAEARAGPAAARGRSPPRASALISLLDDIGQQHGGTT